MRLCKYILALFILIDTSYCFGIKKNKFPKSLSDVYAHKRISVGHLLKEKAGASVVFFSPTCPVCQSHIIELNDFLYKYKEEGMSFAVVIPASLLLKKKEVIDYIDSLNIKIPVYIDRKNRTTDFLNATVMPQVFVLDASEKIIYSGQISNKFLSVGVKKTTNIRYYLEDALKFLIYHNVECPPANLPIGCIIEKYGSH